MKSVLAAYGIAIAIGTGTFATWDSAKAHCVKNCRHNIWSNNQWGYVGLVRSGWGLGGVADAPWVGGSIVGVTSYGPYPYGLYPWSLQR